MRVGSAKVAAAAARFDNRIRNVVPFDNVVTGVKQFSAVV